MSRVLPKFYTFEDRDCDSWAVFEHIDELTGGRVITHLTKDEAIEIAAMLNEEYENDKK